jgi:mono/diheme cytochrome c family protein
MRATLAILFAFVVLAGCSPVSIDQYPCPDGGTTLTYQDFGAPFMSAHCDSCHSAPDGDRNGAPDDYVFATQADIEAHAAQIFLDAADTNDSMPPGPDTIPPEQRTDLAIWLACGAK